MATNQLLGVKGRRVSFDLGKTQPFLSATTVLFFGGSSLGIGDNFASNLKNRIVVLMTSANEVEVIIEGTIQSQRGSGSQLALMESYDFFTVGNFQYRIPISDDCFDVMITLVGTSGSLGGNVDMILYGEER